MTCPLEVQSDCWRNLLAMNSYTYRGSYVVSQSFACIKTHMEVLRERGGKRRTLKFTIKLSNILPKLSEGQKIHPEVEKSQAA